MSQSQTAETVRYFRNFITILVLIIVVLLGCFYITGLLVLISINNDWSIVKTYFNYTLLQQFWAITKSFMKPPPFLA